MPNTFLEVFLSRSTLRPAFNRNAGQNLTETLLANLPNPGLYWRTPRENTLGSLAEFVTKRLLLSGDRGGNLS